MTRWLKELDARLRAEPARKRAAAQQRTAALVRGWVQRADEHGLCFGMEESYSGEGLRACDRDATTTRVFRSIYGENFRMPACSRHESMSGAVTYVTGHETVWR